MTDNRRFLKASFIDNDLRARRTKLAVLAAFLFILCLLPMFLGYYMLHILILIFIYTMASVSLRTITISGQFPLAHAAFMGIGAYLAAMPSRWLGWPAWITIPSASLAAAGIAMLTGYPFARLRSLYYAMGSLFFGIGVLNVIYAGGKITGGYVGLIGIHPLFPASKMFYYYFFLALLVLSLIALYRFEFSRIGNTLRAIAQSHMVSSSVGINEVRYRVLAVGVGSFFAGLAGACYAHYNLVLSTSTFNFLATLWLVMYVLIGGINSFAGPIVGTFVLILISELFRDMGMYSPFVPAALLGAVAYLLPNGLASLPGVVVSRLSHRNSKGANDAS